ncbi:flavin reductase family protein, partial [Streptomyces sp. NPDC004012]
PAVGRLAAEYTLVDNVFTTPLDKDLLTARDGRRMRRLDAHPADWSPIDTGEWSPSGAVSSPGK